MTEIRQPKNSTELVTIVTDLMEEAEKKLNMEPPTPEEAKQKIERAHEILLNAPGFWKTGENWMNAKKTYLEKFEDLNYRLAESLLMLDGYYYSVY